MVSSMVSVQPQVFMLHVYNMKVNSVAGGKISGDISTPVALAGSPLFFTDFAVPSNAAEAPFAVANVNYIVKNEFPHRRSTGFVNRSSLQTVLYCSVGWRR